ILIMAKLATFRFLRLWQRQLRGDLGATVNISGPHKVGRDLNALCADAQLILIGRSPKLRSGQQRLGRPTKQSWTPRVVRSAPSIAYKSSSRARSPLSQRSVP